jgi:hypothetical protein
VSFAGWSGGAGRSLDLAALLEGAGPSDPLYAGNTRFVPSNEIPNGAAEYLTVNSPLTAR